MATTYKDIRDNDIAATRTKLHEAIPITGTITSGTYTDNNIKNYAHGMFQSVYDYPFLSSSANHIFDLTVGVAADDGAYSSITSQQQKKNNIYNQFAQTMVGYDITGNIHQFDVDGILGTGDQLKQALFIPFSRLLTKDEIKKESFSMILGVDPDAYSSPFAQMIKVFDSGAINNYRVNSPAGEYGLLYASNYLGTPISGAGGAGDANAVPVGLIYYQAGLAVLNLTATLNQAGQGATASINGILTQSITSWSAGGTGYETVLASSTIEEFANDFRRRIQNISFNNTTELNSSIYFCRVGHNDYNYSSNPTYLTGSKIKVKNNSTDTPVAYVTTVGLYSADNELMAVAKLSEPLRKDPTQNYTIRVRLDY